MLSIAITAAMIGMLLILFLILREVSPNLASGHRNMLYFGGVLVVAVGIWQAVAQSGGAVH